MSSGGHDPVEAVEDLLERLAEAAGLEASIEIHDQPGGFVAELKGDDLGRLIGHHGQTIDAIQHLAYRFAMNADGNRHSVVVDAGGYRERRAESLRSAADQAAETALNHRRAVPLEAMNALERKVIHEHLKNRRDVETYSEGQEPSRRLVVAPLVN